MDRSQEDTTSKEQGDFGGFNFYKESREYYSKLIPDKYTGLVLISLYDKYAEEEFREEDIINCINFVYNDLGRQSSRREFERNNNIILQLQDYFIWRDEIRRVYRFKKYGSDFCKRIKDRLKESYNPAKVKRWFDELYNSLINNLKGDIGFKKWIEDHFEKRTPFIEEQVEILDQQVDESVKKFKSRLKIQEEEEVFVLLKTVEDHLSTIKQQALELKDAFKTTFEIDDVITEILEDQDVSEFLPELQRVRLFNHKIRSFLEQVSNRIDKIKPRIREFIYNFNQRDFDRKTEAFLRFLLEHSSNVTSSFSHKKNIVLPDNIPLKKISKLDFAPKFLEVPILEISPKKSLTKKVMLVDHDFKEQLYKTQNNWLQEKKRILYWKNQIYDRLNRDSEVDFARFFFLIMETDGKLSTAVSVAQQITRNFGGSADFSFQISNERLTNTKIPRIAIRKFKISRK